MYNFSVAQFTDPVEEILKEYITITTGKPEAYVREYAQYGFDELKEMDNEEPIVLVIKPEVIPAQLEPNIKFITIEDLKPNKLKGSPYFS